jgi:hypothetical protein
MKCVNKDALNPETVHYVHCMFGIHVNILTYMYLYAGPPLWSSG